MKTHLITSFIAMLVCQSAFAFDYKGLDSSNFPPSGWKNFRWSNPGSWTTKNVTSNDVPVGIRITPNDSNVDSAAKLRAIINNFSNVTRLKLFFPNGSYYFKSRLTITRGNIMLDGASRSGVIFRFNVNNGSDIRFVGNGLQGSVTAMKNISRGNKTLTFNNNNDHSNFSVNNYIVAYANATTNLGQIVKITKKTFTGGKRRIEVNPKIGVNLSSVRIRRMSFLGNISVQDITFQRDANTNSNVGFIRFENVNNGRVKTCAFKKVKSNAVGVQSSTRIEITGNSIDGVIGSPSGATGNGYLINTRSTTVHVHNNRAKSLRHHYWVGNGANHVVIAYNNSDSVYRAYGDIGIHHGSYSHNVLIEGNVGRELIIDSFGSNTPAQYITFFRNRAKQKLGNQNNGGTSRTTMIGNIIDVNGFKNTNSSTNYWGYNRINGSLKKNGIESVDLPKSLYITSKPSYLSSFPRYNP